MLHVRIMTGAFLLSSELPVLVCGFINQATSYLIVEQPPVVTRSEGICECQKLKYRPAYHGLISNVQMKLCYVILLEF